jgi:hypothetical protein
MWTFTCLQYCSKLDWKILSPSSAISVSNMSPLDVPSRMGPVVTSESLPKFHPTAVTSWPLNLLGWKHDVTSTYQLKIHKTMHTAVLSLTSFTYQFATHGSVWIKPTSTTSKTTYTISMFKNSYMIWLKQIAITRPYKKVESLMYICSLSTWYPQFHNPIILVCQSQ